jgi:hypothetical protein
MKKISILVIMFVVTNMISQNYCVAQDKLKPENCSYFQVADTAKLSEWIWVGSDRSGKNNKWLELDNLEGATAYIETNRDEWSIYLKAVKDNTTIQIDLYKMQLIAGIQIFKINNVKDQYDYDKLGGDYIKNKLFNNSV